MVRQPVDDPLAHLDLTSLIAIWPQLSEQQRAACAAYRGVGVDDLGVLFEMVHGDVTVQGTACRG